VVWPDVLVACNRRIDAEVLLHGAPAAVLDRGPSLDDEGDRGGPTLGRLLEGTSHERARCLRGIPVADKLIESGERKLGGIATSKARLGLPYPRRVNTNQSISSVTASS
jgi:hypothetical protein